VHHRADRDRVDDGAHADVAAEQPAYGEDRQLDPGAHDPDRAAARAEAGGQAVARAGS
jgi:hypothetical protein